MVNFAYEKIIFGGIGRNTYGKNSKVNQKGILEKGKDVGRYFFENHWMIHKGLRDIPFWFKRNGIEVNIITLEDALKSDDEFIHYFQPKAYFIFHDDLSPKNKFLYLSTELVEAINNRQCKFIIWDQESQPHNQENSDILSEELKDAMIIPDNVIYITNNVQQKYQSDFKVIVWEYWESFISHQSKLENIKPKKKNAKKFMSLNLRPTDERIYFIRKMWENGILDQFNVSLGKVEGDDDFAKSTPYNFDDFSNVPWEYRSYKKIAFLFPLHQQESYLYIVTETDYNPPLSTSQHMFTEKTWKPIAMKMPFITIGQPHTLKLLRELGYKTFPWDESYDEITDPDKRMAAIIDLVVYLNSRNDFVELIESCEDIVNHNFDLLKTRRPETDMIRTLS